jgi:hypothetical protein
MKCRLDQVLGDPTTYILFYERGERVETPEHSDYDEENLSRNDVDWDYHSPHADWGDSDDGQKTLDDPTASEEDEIDTDPTASEEDEIVQSTETKAVQSPLQQSPLQQ